MRGLRGSPCYKTRPSRIPPLPVATADHVVAMTNQAPPHEATHWMALAAQGYGDQPVLGAPHMDEERTAAASGHGRRSGPGCSPRVRLSAIKWHPRKSNLIVS